ncbi:NfeD family protein [Bogoriella caseilytica]|uniref:Membrane protein implicated in regulation of membrane protease activity n=1 Tax=Bogoriella caseilytica TaxID=56055 RepID=A0A3N2BG76_9MICO|nr:NfeD family protein [Bogoriella caseilytica]ROR74266.1 membrane protein implicated in regulation of membrane protease activity [Bogoriella caseilytica]
MGWLWWIGAALIFGVIEMLTLSYVFFMLAIGALAGALLAAFDAPLWAQFATVALVSMLLLWGARPYVKGWVERTVPRTNTNVDALAGRQAIVEAEVTGIDGRVKLAGEIWSARMEEPGPPLAPGSTVVVAAIDGATAIVKPLPASPNDPQNPYPTY